MILCLACGGQVTSLVVFNVFSNPRLVEEVIEIRTTVGAPGILCQTKVSCSFVTPVVKFSENAIEFRVEMVSTAFCVVFNCFVCFSAWLFWVL